MGSDFSRIIKQSGSRKKTVPCLHGVLSAWLSTSSCATHHPMMCSRMVIIYLPKAGGYSQAWAKLVHRTSTNHCSLPVQESQKVATLKEGAIEIESKTRKVKIL